MKALILAGGRGTRLWPLSRQYKPKQFQPIFGQKTLLQQTFERILPVFSLKDIFVATNQYYLEEVKKELPKLPRSQIISEPAFRERVAAFLLFFCYLKNLNEPVAIFPSDHLIKELKKFQQFLIAGENFIKNHPQYILLFGEKPNFPDTGLGYIKKGSFLKEEKELEIYKVEHFKEKPNLKSAKEFLKSGQYFWNVGIFIFYPSLIIKLTQKFVPDNYQRYLKIKKAIRNKNFKQVLEREYLKMDTVSFDYSILENYRKNAFLPFSLGWSDIGSWTVLKNCLVEPGKNYIKGNYLGLDSKDVLVHGTNNQLVTTVGVKDLIIVVNQDVIFICHKKSSQKVKDLIKKLEKKKKFDYL